MADFVCHCTSHLDILRGDEEMDDCCLGVSALFFHPGSVTILKKKNFTSLFCLLSLSLILSRLLMRMLMLMIKLKHIMP